jgi:putative nucleotidyltransferase with HDIG domain
VIYLAANFLNFLLIVGYLCLRNGTSLLEAVRQLYLPVVPWEIATGALTAGTVIAYQEIGLLAVGLLAAMLLSYRYLLGAVVDAQRQRDELREQVEELEALHSGVIRVMVETLGMRDRMTARHSAAVARFAKATAAAAGLSPREQELVHTAGLLHDVGKFTFPDHTLTGTSLTEEDWALIYSHPQRGADIVGRVRGYQDVAEIVLCHHERIDGRGYPRNLGANDIPVLSRVLAVADCFDVMTARDSYRAPMSVPAAIAELRRVAGTQLDARFVEIFVGVIEGSGVDFQHADDEDLEAELRRQAPRGSATRS